MRHMVFAQGVLSDRECLVSVSTQSFPPYIDPYLILFYIFVRYNAGNLSSCLLANASAEIWYNKASLAYGGIRMRRACSFTTFKALEGFKKTLGCKGEVVHRKTDEELFFEAMADVREIKEFREIPFQKSPGIKPRVEQGDNSIEVLRQIVEGKKKIRLSDTGEYMEWTCPSLRGNISRRLHEGCFAVQDSIDLHGMTLGEAEEALRLFFREAIRKRLFCIKVIHGRGLRSPKGPVLKEALNKWLRGSFRKWVLAYATAKDCDGGLGATYIILRSR